MRLKSIKFVRLNLCKNVSWHEGNWWVECSYWWLCYSASYIFVLLQVLAFRSSPSFPCRPWLWPSFLTFSEIFDRSNRSWSSITTLKRIMDDKERWWKVKSSWMVIGGGYGHGRSPIKKNGNERRQMEKNERLNVLTGR